MKTVAHCPSDMSSGAGTGTAPQRELKGDRKTNKDREKMTRKGGQTQMEHIKTGQGGSFDANVV